MSAHDVTLRPVRSVLHVLPHPGGGGETYVDSLSPMQGYEFEKVYLASRPRPADALRSLGSTVPKVMLSARSHDIVHIQGEVASGICLPILGFRPSVVTFNGLNLISRVDGFAHAAAKVNLRLIVRTASRTICVSQSERRNVLSVVGSRTGRRVVQIHNGVAAMLPPTEDERANARQSLGLPKSASVGAWLGGLDLVKDPLVPVRAAIEVARSGIPFHLLMAGEGPLRGAIEGEIAHGGGDTIRLLGFSGDTRRVLAASDFFVMSSQREGFSFALLEAMASGLAPVVSDAPGIVEAVDEAGVVVGRGDVSGFRDAFAEISRDAPRRARLGELARRRVLEFFQVEGMIRSTAEVYADILH